jgi:acetylornithine/succinyldiaminopimelate/putrescine aminotransferase/predicted amino acid dehydrogenase
MTPKELLGELRERGVKLWVEGPELRFSAPKGALASPARELLSRHKLELMQLLSPAKEGSSQQASRGFSLDRQVIPLGSLRNWRADDQNAYIRYVAPYKGFLYQRLGLDKTFVRGEGCYLYDAEGAPYVDFVAQFGAVPFGHNPECIWRAVEMARCDMRPNLAIASISPVAGELAERLLSIAPAGLSHVVFTNSGAESVEVAIKLARCRTGRLGILSSRDGFHGLTLAGMSATDKDFFQQGFGAPVPGFNYVPFGDLSALQAALELRPDFFAAFIVEVVQGESGIHVAPRGYLAAARELCRRFGALLIVDEVQTGLGRTGKLFACEEEGITPDILALAKALGGGLMPIGACLYTREAYSEHFDLRHGSTFAGNTLACRVALATIDELMNDNQHLVRHVAETSRRLQEQLRQLQREFPMLLSDIRGRGLMLGVELNLDRIGETQSGLLAILQRQNLLLYVIVSFLLNAERIRIAASFTAANVLRIEPPLIADSSVCDRLIGAVRRLLGILHAGDAGALLAPLMGRSEPRISVTDQREPVHASVAATPRIESGKGKSTRFAFVVHLLSAADLRRCDPSLQRFDAAEIDRLRSSILEFIRPFPHSELAVRCDNGSSAEGELIVLPHLAPELLALSGSEAVSLVQAAVDLAAERGAEVVGLGGFSSIIADGGLAVQPHTRVTVTSGNSLTAWAAIRAIELACAEHGLDFGQCTVAIVGATGAIGQALALLCAERAAELILLGNPRSSQASVMKLRGVAQKCRQHVVRLASSGREFSPGCFAQRHRAGAIDGVAELPGGIIVTTDIDHHLPTAGIVLAATNAVTPFITGRHLGRGTLVCDISRPLSIMADLQHSRPDLVLVNGGLMRAPHGSTLGDLEERDHPNVLVACAAEAMVLAASRFRSPNLCGQLDVSTIGELGCLAERMGFTVAV